jgi:hypothetical protein
LATSNPTQAAAEPGVGQGAVDPNGFLKGCHRGIDSILSAQQETAQRVPLGIARSQVQSAGERFLGLGGSAKAELQLGNSRPRETKLGRLIGGPLSGDQSAG